MSLQTVSQLCTTLPGAVLSDPWGDGHHVWKVGGKIFASIGARNLGVAVKTADADTAAFLIDMGRAVRAPYFHRSWVRLDWGMVPDDELVERVMTSYTLIRASLPKRVQLGLQG